MNEIKLEHIENVWEKKYRKALEDIIECLKNHSLECYGTDDFNMLKDYEKQIFKIASITLGDDK